MASFTSSSGKVGPDERRELEAAGTHVVEQDGQRDRGILGAVHRPREPLLAAHELARVEVEACAGGRETDDDARPTARVCRERGRGRRRVADRVERVVRAVRRDLRQQLVEPLGRDRVRRAERERLVAAPRERIDADDRRRTRDAGALHDELAHAARTDHDHARPRRHARAEEHRPDAGQRRAPEQRRLAGAGSRRRWAARRARRRRPARRGTPWPCRGTRSPVASSSRCCRRRACRRRSRGAAARMRPDVRAGSPAHSPHDGAQDSTTSSPGATRVTSSPDLLDDARALVTEHHRRRPPELALHLVQVGAADPHRDHADDDVARRPARRARSPRPRTARRPRGRGRRGSSSVRARATL